MVIENRYIRTCSKQQSITLHCFHSFVLLHCLVSTAFYFHITCIPSSTWSFMVTCCNRIFSGALQWWGVNFLYLCGCFLSAASQAHWGDSWGDSVQGLESDSMTFVGPFQLIIFCDFVNLFRDFYFNFNLLKTEVLVIFPRLDLNLGK